MTSVFQFGIKTITADRFVILNFDILKRYRLQNDSDNAVYNAEHTTAQLKAVFNIVRRYFALKKFLSQLWSTLSERIVTREARLSNTKR